MKLAVLRSLPGLRPPGGADDTRRYGLPDELDDQIDDLLAAVTADTGLDWHPNGWPAATRPARRRFRPLRRIGRALRIAWRWRRATVSFAATLIVSTAIAVATVYLASKFVAG